MVDTYQRGFNFNPAEMIRKLDLFEDQAHRFIEEDVRVHASSGEAAMKKNAPWKNRTWNARNGLWADGSFSDEQVRIHMGHSVEYGVYLEESNGGHYQIVMPTLVETARSFMRSMEHMFAQMETRTHVTPVIAPGGGARPGTSQNAKTRTTGADSKPNVTVRTERGQFADQGKGFSKAAKAAKAAAKKIAAVNARRRERYAARKAEGTLPTKRTKKG